MRILLADKLPAFCIDRLNAKGHEVHNRPELTGDALAEGMSEINPEAMVVRSTKVPSEAMDRASSLRLIVRAGAGVDNIDLNGATDRGISVANCPGKNAAAVAELTMGLLLSLDRSIPDNVMDARQGSWNKALYGKAGGVKGKTLGIIGMGSIGREVVKRAKAFDMRIVGMDIMLTDEGAAVLGIERKETPVEVAAESDFVTLHVASTLETKGMANEEFFAAMKPGACFINTTRAAVVDEDALVKAMEEKGIRAALDVFSGEPSHKEGPFSDPLALRSDIYLTHHIGASTMQAQEAVAEEAIRVILTLAESGEVPNCVNAPIGV